jgi:subtilisin family serine protease
MKKMFWLWIVGLGLFLTMVTLAQAPPKFLSVARFEPITDYVPNQVLVLVNPSRIKLTSSTTTVDRKNLIINLVGVLNTEGFEVLPAIDMRSLALTGTESPQNLSVCDGILLTVTHKNFNGGVDGMLEAVNQVIQRFIASNRLSGTGIYMIVPNDAYTRPDAEMSSPVTEFSTNFDGLFGSARGVKIAVLDSGFVIPKIVESRSMTGLKTIQDSTELESGAFVPYPYDVNPPSRSGWDVDKVIVHDDTPRVSIPPDPPIRPDVYGHGTPVLGIISSIARGATIIPIKACNDLGYCTGKSVTLGLCFAFYMRAKVINASFGGFYNSSLVQGAVRDVIANGGLVVAGAGNSRNLAWHRTAEEKSIEILRPADDLVRGWNRPVYPAAWSRDTSLAIQRLGGFQSDGLVSVGSIPPDESNPPNSVEKISNFSTLNDNVDVVTYGENIETDYSLDSSFVNFARHRVLRSGTSFSAPVISGIAAVTIRTHPSNTPGQIENNIVATGVTSSYECLLYTSLTTTINECRKVPPVLGLHQYSVSKLNRPQLQLLLR